MRRGVENRRTGETKMNRESSRSHCVFSCSLEGNSKGTGGLTNTRFSRLNLIDLAGGLMPVQCSGSEWPFIALQQPEHRYMTMSSSFQQTLQAPYAQEAY